MSISYLFSNQTFWLVIGFLGQALFSMRFIIQWIASEKKKKKYYPKRFLVFFYRRWHNFINLRNL